MYNSFIALKKSKQKLTIDTQQKRLDGWFRRYKTEVRPNLVNNFNKRINGFAKKMQDQPLIVHIEDNNQFKQKFRKTNPQLNISRDGFKYHKFHDMHQTCQSITKNRSINNKTACGFHKSTIDSQNKNKHGSVSRYEDHKTEYRKRFKQKQINPPMKFHRQNAKNRSKNHSLRHKNNKIKQTLNSTNNPHHYQQHSAQINNNISRQSLQSEGRDSDFGGISDIDLASLYNYSITNKKKDKKKSQLQLIQQQQLKALAHEKIYFKSLLQLANSVKNKREQQQYRNTLKKCKIIKDLNNGKKKQQIDRLYQMILKI